MEINKIYLGDAYSLIKDIPDKSVDLVVTDPPYDFSTGYKKESNKVLTKKEAQFVAQSKYANKFGEYKSRVSLTNQINHLSNGVSFKELLPELDRVMKKTNIYIWCNKTQVKDYLDYYIEKGCNFDILMWGKDNPLPTCNNQYLHDIEYCLFFRDKGVKVYGDFDSLKHFWVTHTNMDDKEHYLHPTIKPLNIIKDLIQNSSQEGQLVFDPFIGSGTTVVAAKQLKRNFLGFEINKKYFGISTERLNGIDVFGQTDLFNTDFDSLSAKGEE